MTYSMMVGKYKLIFSDTHFKDFRKKPTISVYDADANSEIKIASFNSQETFEWFIEAVVEADRKTEPQTNADQHVQRVEYVENDEKSRCWTCKHFERMYETPISSDGTYYPYVICTASECRYEPKDEPQIDAEEVAKDINRRVEMVKKEWKARHIEDEPQTCDTCKWGEWYRQGYDITMMDDECGGCCSWNSKWTPKTEETEMERLERIDNEIEDAWARIRELTDEPQTERSE